MQPIIDHDFVAAPAATYMIDGDVDLARLVWRLTAAGWRPLLIDRHVAGDKQLLLDAFAVGLRFPDWFGRNWDALVDLVRDWSNYQPLAVLIADMGDGGISNPTGDEADDGLATIATLTDIVDTLVTQGYQLKLGMIPTR